MGNSDARIGHWLNADFGGTSVRLAGLASHSEWVRVVGSSSVDFIEGTDTDVVTEVSWLVRVV